MPHELLQPAKVITIVTPFFNEEQTIAHFEDEIVKVVKDIQLIDFEFIFVDDGSSDNTLLALLDWKQRDQRICVIEFSRNFGKEAALSAGIEHASGDAIIIIDADLQDPIWLVREFINVWEKGNVDVVLAKRQDRASDTFPKRCSALIFYWLINFISSEKLPKNVGDCRLLDRKVVNAILRLPEKKRFMKGLMSWVGFKTETVEYTRANRIAGKTKLNFFKLWHLAIDGIVSASILPVTIWIYVGLCGFLFALIFGVKILVSTLIYGVDQPGYASTVIVILFFGSLQLLCLGVMGEYVGRIYHEVRGRPSYLIRRKHGPRN